MSTCMFYVANICDTDKLRKELVENAEKYGFGVDFYPFNNLLIHMQVPLRRWDFVFSLCDSFSHKSCDLVVYREEYPFNKRTHPLPLYERLMIIQEIAKIVLSYNDQVEIFLSDDNPYLPDFANADIPWNEVAKTLYDHYSLVPNAWDIPDVHLTVHK